MKKSNLGLLAALLVSGASFAQVSIQSTGSNSVVSIVPNGSENVAIGTVIPGGSASTAVGSGSLSKNTGGIGNSAFGYGALRNNNGYENCAFGLSALSLNSAGSYNVAIGTAAGKNSLGSYNTYLGSSSGFNVTGSNNTIIGARILGTSSMSNHVIIGDGAGNQRIFITNLGNMGLGNTNPQARLEVTSGTTGVSGLRFTNLLSTSTAAATNGKALTVDALGNVILVPMVAAPAVTNGWTNIGNATTNPATNFLGTTDAQPLVVRTSNIEAYRVAANGKVSVGTVNAPTTIGGADINAYRLFVKGGILTDEVRVRTAWADYVFANDYTLKPLAEVEKYIVANKHLPNVPSAKTVENEGVSVGNMLRIQQEKIEELTLYLIQLQKEVNTLKQSVK